MKTIHDNNKIILTLENTQEIIKFKRILNHAEHDFRLFPVKPERMQVDYKFLQEIGERI